MNKDLATAPWVPKTQRRLFKKDSAAKPPQARPQAEFAELAPIIDCNLLT